MSRGHPGEAAQALMSHERRFPDGQLAEERDVLLIEAYLAAGSARLARRRIAQSQTSHPTGAHRARVAEALRSLRG